MPRGFVHRRVGADFAAPIVIAVLVDDLLFGGNVGLQEFGASAGAPGLCATIDPDGAAPEVSVEVVLELDQASAEEGNEVVHALILSAATDTSGHTTRHLPFGDRAALDT